MEYFRTMASGEEIKWVTEVVIWRYVGIVTYRKAGEGWSRWWGKDFADLSTAEEWLIQEDIKWRDRPDPEEVKEEEMRKIYTGNGWTGD